MTKLKVLAFTAALAVLALAGTVSGAKCGKDAVSNGVDLVCPNNMCCSKDGECGIGELYCDDGCQSGACYDKGNRRCGREFGNATCPSNYCCSDDGYCGLGSRYCGTKYGCQSGPCAVKCDSCAERQCAIGLAYSQGEEKYCAEKVKCGKGKECPNNLCCGKLKKNDDVDDDDTDYECGIGPQYCADTCISGPCQETKCDSNNACTNNYCCGNGNAKVRAGGIKTCGLGHEYCCNNCTSGACGTWSYSVLYPLIPPTCNQ